MGLMQRQKGARSERQLVEHLTELGYNAKRVPLSGAAQGFKGDVWIEQDGQTVNIEVKSRYNEFRKMYSLLDILKFRNESEAQKQHGKIQGVETEKFFVMMSYDFKDMTGGHNYIFIPATTHKFLEPNKRTLRRLDRMQTWLGEAQILAIKNDYRPWIFLRFHDKGVES